MGTMRFPCSVMSALMLAGCGTVKVAPKLVPATHAPPVVTRTNTYAGFTDHGFVTPPKAGSSGLVVTKDGAGRGVVLVWLTDHRGGYAVLEIDADTGESLQRPVPFPTSGGMPVFTMLSRDNKYYAHFRSFFCEYDPAARDFTFWTNTATSSDFSIIVEDKQGIIWSVTGPESGLVSFDPKTRAFKDYGHLYKQNWVQLMNGLATDDAGWMYWGIGPALCQIIAFDPKTGTVKPLIPEEKRHLGYASVYRAENGKVYGFAGGQAGWLECHAGEARKIEGKPPERENLGIKGKQLLFPDGRRLVSMDLGARILVVEGPKTGETKRVSFSCKSEGSGISGVAAAPDGTICGGTSCFFSYNPKTGRFINQPKIGQWNTVTSQGGRFYVGCYTGGYLLEWDPARPWVETKYGDTNSNPLHLGENREVMNRPHDLLALPDGKTVVMSGSPVYGATGGGLVFWDNQARTKTQVTHTDIIPEHTTMSMVALRGGKILGGTSTRPGSFGIRKAKEAELYIMDTETKKIEWHTAVFPGAQEVTDMCLGPDGLVYGLVGFTPWDPAVLTYGKRFFVFDPVKRKVIHDEDTEAEFGPIGYQQGPRNLFVGPDGSVYVLFLKGIARFDPAASRLGLLAESPVPIEAGGDLLDGRIYFACGSHLYSYTIPEH